MHDSTHADSSSDEDEVTSRPPAAVIQLRALTLPQRAAADRTALARQQLLMRAFILHAHFSNKQMTGYDTHCACTQGQLWPCEGCIGEAGLHRNS